MKTLEEMLESGREQGLFTHAGACVMRGDETLFEVGDVSTIFDVASLTKIFTATLALDLLDPEALVEGRWSVGDLLAHRSGLPAWRPLFAEAARSLGLSPAELVERSDLHEQARAVYRRALVATPCDAPRPTYSDLGFLALGFALEDAAGMPIDEIARDRLFTPLGLVSSAWGQSPTQSPLTGRTRPRPALPVGSEALAAPEPSLDAAVDDDNAAAIGGRAGHAGVWSSARDIAKLGSALLESSVDPRRSLLFQRAEGARTYGLDTPSGPAPSIGTLLGRGEKGAAGHLGYTGCSLWMDRDAGLSIALLTNAVSRERPTLRLREWRRTFHDACAPLGHS